MLTFLAVVLLSNKKVLAALLTRTLLASTCALLINGCATNEDERGVAVVTVDQNGRKTVHSITTGTLGNSEAESVWPNRWTAFSSV
jgi:hypothetical protein